MLAPSRRVAIDVWLLVPESIERQRLGKRRRVQRRVPTGEERMSRSLLLGIFQRTTIGSFGDSFLSSWFSLSLSLPPAVSFPPRLLVPRVPCSNPAASLPKKNLLSVSL